MGKRMVEAMPETKLHASKCENQYEIRIKMGEPTADSMEELIGEATMRELMAETKQRA